MLRFVQQLAVLLHQRVEHLLPGAQAQAEERRLRLGQDGDRRQRGTSTLATGAAVGAFPERRYPDRRRLTAAAERHGLSELAAFDESLHPRDDAGKFTESGGATHGTAVEHAPPPAPSDLRALLDAARENHSPDPAALLPLAVALPELVPIPDAQTATSVDQIGSHVTFMQRIRDASGRAIASATRYLDFRTRTIDLHRFVLDPSLTRHGIGTAYHAAVERAARAAGFTRMTMLAVSDGRGNFSGAYAWAREPGWDFITDTERARMVREFGKWLGSHGYSADDMPRRLTPQALAACTIRGKRVGRDFLLGTDASWEGVKSALQLLDHGLAPLDERA